MEKIEYKAFSPKDVKLLKDNPAASPYELLQLGLSKKGYDRLMNADDKVKELDNDGIIKPTSVIEVLPPIDKTVNNQKLSQNPNGSVNVQNTVTGNLVTTSLYFANMLIKDGKHKIV